MKKFILILLLLFSILEAKEDNAFITVVEQFGETKVFTHSDFPDSNESLFKDINVSLSYFKTSDETIDNTTIENYDKAFKTIPKTEKFIDTTHIYWLKVDLGNNFPEGRFYYGYGDANFIEHTVTPKQTLEKLNFFFGSKFMQFTYHKTDSQIYYFKLQVNPKEPPLRYLNVQTEETFFHGNDRYILLFFSGFLALGIILMAGLYNGAMYLFNRQKAFLHYMFFQLFMVVLLFFDSGILLHVDNLITRSSQFMGLITLVTVLFSILFTQSFLDTKRYLPKTHKMLNIFIVIVILDMFISLFDVSYIVKYKVLPFSALVLLAAGILRIRQGFKPAWYYTFGWVALVISLFFYFFFMESIFFHPIFVGSAIEAILFSFALSYKVKMLADEQEQQKELMVHQSKLASMGEMVGNIAHQWRQPLTHLSYSFMNLKEAQTQNKLTPEYLNEKIVDATKQLEFMSQTIDDFKEFYKPNKPKEAFSLEVATKETLELVQNSLQRANITVNIETKEDAKVTNYKNEFKQVLMNLLLNAKDALVEKGVSSPTITIHIKGKTLSVVDNAGKIDKEVQKRLFEPYFTTKEQSSGIGLYMSKMIVEKNMGGTLVCETGEAHTTFTITIKE